MIVGKTRLAAILAPTTSVGCHEPPAGNRIERLAEPGFASEVEFIAAVIGENGERAGPPARYSTNSTPGASLPLGSSARFTARISSMPRSP